MVILGSVLETFSAPVGVKGKRPVVESLNMIEGFGIEGDKFAGGNLDKSVMVVGKKAYDMADEHNISLSGGELGENILLDFDPHEFANGTVFQIGQAQIKIVEPCTLCKHLAIYDPKLPKLILNHRGQYCSIVKSGIVKKGDRVYLIS